MTFSDFFFPQQSQTKIYLIYSDLLVKYPKMNQLLKHFSPCQSTVFLQGNKQIFSHLGAADTPDVTDTLSSYSCLFRHSANMERHKHLFGVLFWAINLIFAFLLALFLISAKGISAS